MNFPAKKKAEEREEARRKAEAERKVHVVKEGKREMLESKISLTKQSIKDNTNRIIDYRVKIETLTRTNNGLKAELAVLEAELASLTRTGVDLQLISHRIDRLMSLIERQ